MMEDKHTCLGVILVLLCCIPLTIFEGFLFSVYWRWFIVPLGVMPIGVAHGVGLSTLLSTLKLSIKNNDTKSDKDLVTKLLAAVLATLMIFVVAFVAHLCM